MKKEELEDLFQRHEEEFLRFDKVEDKKSERADLHAFLLLDKLVPGNQDIVCSAEHDEIWLGVESDELCLVITEEQITELIRCGVRYYEGSLCMYA